MVNTFYNYWNFFIVEKINLFFLYCNSCGISYGIKDFVSLVKKGVCEKDYKIFYIIQKLKLIGIMCPERNEGKDLRGFTSH